MNKVQMNKINKLFYQVAAFGIGAAIYFGCVLTLAGAKYFGAGLGTWGYRILPIVSVYVYWRWLKREVPENAKNT